jgi:predicted transcriptional regulator
MKLIRKILAFLFLSFGIPFTLYALVEIANPQQPEDRENAMAALFILTLPSTAIGGWLAWGLMQEHKQKQQDILAKSEENLRSIFFQLLEEKEGAITILQMAKAANLNGEEAKEYLDQKAEEFNATFDVNEEGGIIYRFPR